MNIILMLLCSKISFADEAPNGWLDVANADQIGGWAQDSDYDGPIMVHVYVDGVLMKALLADGPRSDVGDHAFSWVPPPYGDYGEREVIVYGIGVDESGNPNGINPSLSGSPLYYTSNFDGLSGSALDWSSVEAYWTYRQEDTVMVGNDTVRAGVNEAYGGTLFQLYDDDWQTNLTLEHGGGAIQLSVWGYADSSLEVHDAFLECIGATIRSDHAGDLDPPPFNPIQAISNSSSYWERRTIDEAYWDGDSYYTRLEYPNDYFLMDVSPVHMPMEQWVTPHTGYLELRYELSYTTTGESCSDPIDYPAEWAKHSQEIPAFFTAAGMYDHYYYYGGDQPFTSDTVSEIVGSSETFTFLRFPHPEDEENYAHLPPDYDISGYVKEGWWGVCDEDEDRCVTLAAFDSIFKEVHLDRQGSEGYITPLGYFSVQNGMDLEWVLYVFPYKYDAVIGDQTVREIIYDLASDEFKERTALYPATTDDTDTDGDGLTDSDEANILAPILDIILSSDDDEDGYDSEDDGGDDCDDSDPLIYVGATETCGDGIDQNCDGADSSCDTDGDGLNDADEVVEGSDPNDPSSTACVPPSSGTDWNVTHDCTFTNSKTYTGDVTIQNNAVMTIPDGISLDMDFATYKLVVQSGSGVLIEEGGSLR